MGWWKIDPSGEGGIDWKHQTGTGLLNAMPGSHPENYYNGDGPADIIGNAVKEIEAGFKRIDYQPTRQDFVWLFLKFPQFIHGVIDGANANGGTITIGNFSEEFPPFTRIEDSTETAEEITALALKSVSEITELYQEAWKRPPYIEEMEAVVNFCINHDYPE